MRRALIIASILIFLIAGGYAFYALVLHRSATTSTTGTAQNATSEDGTLPDIPNAGSSFPNGAIPTTPTVDVTGSGGVVTVNNFYTNAHQVTGTDVFISSSLEYDLIYSRTNSAFTIQLFPTDTASYNEYRAKAEAALLTTLGISQADACRLRAIVEIPDSYLETLTAPASSPLSFCASPEVQFEPSR